MSQNWPVLTRPEVAGFNPPGDSLQLNEIEQKALQASAEAVRKVQHEAGL